MVGWAEVRLQAGSFRHRESTHEAMCLGLRFGLEVGGLARSHVRLAWLNCQQTCFCRFWRCFGEPPAAKDEGKAVGMHQLGAPAAGAAPLGGLRSIR